MSEPDRPRGGRPRDPSRDVAILDATLDVLADQGYGALTMDAVATTAGAGKATVYRRWATKADLVLEAVTRMDAGRLDPGSLPDTGSLRGDLDALLGSGDGGDAERRLRIMASLTSLLSESPALGEAADAAVIGPWAAANLVLIRRAIERGEIAPVGDPELLARIVPTLVAYRVCIQRLPIPNDFVATVIEQVLLPALGVDPAEAVT